jgi:hypothetical protein
MMTAVQVFWPFLRCQNNNYRSTTRQAVNAGPQVISQINRVI